MKKKHELSKIIMLISPTWVHVVCQGTGWIRYLVEKSCAWKERLHALQFAVPTAKVNRGLDPAPCGGATRGWGFSSEEWGPNPGKRERLQVHVSLYTQLPRKVERQSKLWAS